MPSTQNITNIPAPRVDFIDKRTNLMSREWYRFFLNLFVLTGSGSNVISLDELELGPASEITPGMFGLDDPAPAMAELSMSVADIRQDLQTRPDTNTAIAALSMSVFDIRQDLQTQPVSFGGTVSSVNTTLATTGTDVSFSATNNTTTPVIALSIPTASATNRGALSSTDWTTFNNKGSGTVTSVTGTSPVVSSGGTTPAISMPAATTSVSGYLTSTDWTTFNNKGSGTVTSVTGTAPVVSSGGATPAISMPAATTSVSGYLTSTDWTTFNNKGSGTVTSVSGSGGTTGLTLTGGPITTTGTLTLGGTLAVANGGTGTATAFTAGSVVFAGASGVYAQDNANLFWDDTNNRLGVGTATPAYTLDVLSSDTTAGLGYAARIRANATAAAGTIQFTDSGATAEWGYLAVAATTATLSSSATGSVLIRAGAATRFQFGSSGQLGIGGATYGSSGQVLTSGGASAAPTWATPATGSVTSVSGTGTVNGISLSGTVTTSGSLTLGGTLSGVSLTTQVSGILPVANGGTGASTLPGIRSNGQNVIGSSVTLGSADDGTNILIVTSGITITFPASGFATGHGFAISNVSGGIVTLAAPGGSDFGTILPNNGTFFAFCDGGGFWRQYCYSITRL